MGHLMELTLYYENDILYVREGFNTLYNRKIHFLNEDCG